MISRERLIASINHREPDKIPLDIGSIIVAGIQAVIYKKLKDVLEVRSGDIYVYDVIQQLALVEDEVREKLGIDTISIIPDKLSDLRERTMSDGTPCKYPERVGYFYS